MLQFSEIDRRRQMHGIEQKALAVRAGLHPQTYSKLRRPAPRGPTEATLKRLTAALDALIAERAANYAQNVNCGEGRHGTAHE